MQPTTAEEQKLHSQIKTKTEVIKSKYEQFEVLDDESENITVKMPEDDDDNSFAIVQ